MHCGADVRDAASSEAALAAINETLPDVVLADIGLPEKDGYALLNEIRAVDRGRYVPVAAVTAYARPEDRDKLVSAGFDAHLPKPAELRSIVETVLRLWHPPA
jgi:CheY-like chemotaxis protein